MHEILLYIGKDFLQENTGVKEFFGLELPYGAE